MARQQKSTVALGETELEVLRHVWALKEPTVADVHARILADRPLAYTTVMTVLKNLADKGYLESTREGHRDRYRALRSPESVRGGLLSALVGKVFGGSPSALVQALVEQEPLSDEERAELRRLIETL